MLDKLGLGFRKFSTGGAASFSLEEFFLTGSDGKDSLLARAGKMQIMTLLPVKNAASFVPAEAAIAFVRGEVAALRKLPEFSGVTVGLTGAPVLENEEMATSQKDISLATIVSLVLTVLLLLLVFRGVLNVFAAMVSLLVAISVSFGFATVAIGHLNILSMVFAIMLIGIGIEYGIQVVLRYQEELRIGKGAAGVHRDRAVAQRLGDRHGCGDRCGGLFDLRLNRLQGDRRTGHHRRGGRGRHLRRRHLHRASRHAGAAPPAQAPEGAPSEDEEARVLHLKTLRGCCSAIPGSSSAATALLCVASIYPLLQDRLRLQPHEPAGQGARVGDLRP